MKLQVWVMFLAVFIICEAAAKPKMKYEPQNELLSSEVEKLQDVPHLHNEEADKSHMNKMERKIQGKKAKPEAKPAYLHRGIAYYPPCPKGQFHSNKIGADYSKCVKAFPLRN